MRSLISMALLLLSCVSVVSADRVQMKDGRLFEGKILSDGREALVIDAMIVGIRGKVTLKKAEIDWYEEKPLPEGFFDKKQHADRLVEESIFFIEVPIVGWLANPEFIYGTPDTVILPSGVDRALAYAVDHGIKHVLLRIDCIEGVVDAAREIVRSMEKYGDRLEYHAVIERAAGPAIGLVFASDSIHIQKAGIIGGAATHAKDNVGTVEGEENLNSILGAELRAIAQSKGHSHSRVLIQAMISPAATAYAWEDTEGRLNITAGIPAETRAKRVRALDTDNTILTLTATEAIAIGLAQPAPLTSEELGEYIGIKKWRRANYYGELLIVYERAFKTDNSDDQVIDATIYAQDPEALIYPYDAETGRLTRSAQRKWLKRLETARSAWRKRRASIEEGIRIGTAIQRAGGTKYSNEEWDHGWEVYRKRQAKFKAEIEAIWARRGLETNRRPR